MGGMVARGYHRDVARRLMKLLSRKGLRRKRVERSLRVMVIGVRAVFQGVDSVYLFAHVTANVFLFLWTKGHVKTNTNNNNHGYLAESKGNEK